MSSGWRTIKVTYYERNAIAKWVAISCITSTIKDKNRFYRLFLLLLAPVAIHNVLYLQTAGNYHNWLNLKAKMLHKIILNVSQPPISNQNIIISTKWNRWAHYQQLQLLPSIFPLTIKVVGICLPKQSSSWNVLYSIGHHIRKKEDDSMQSNRIEV